MLREPFGQSIERYAALLHPTLVLVNKDSREHLKFGRHLRQTMSACTYHEYSSKKVRSRTYLALPPPNPARPRASRNLHARAADEQRAPH